MPSPSQPPIIHIATALIFNDKGQTLLVRKKGSRFFMQAGGKIDAEETPAQALARELKEELGITVSLNESDFWVHSLRKLRMNPATLFGRKCSG